MRKNLHPPVERICEDLRGHYLFAGLRQDELAGLAASVSVQELDAGERLFTQGDPAQRFFYMADGQIKLYRLSPDGHEKIVEIMTPGKTFAEAVMFFEGRRYPVNAEALVASVVYGIHNDAYLELLRANPAYCMRLLADMSSRLHSQLGEIDALAVQNAGYRVQRYLESLLPPEARDGCELELEVPKQVVAARLSIKPETLSRVLHNLTSAGIISVTGRRIRVKDVDSLRRY